MYGLLAGLLWAFDTVILSYGMDKIGLNLFIIPLIVTGIHDLISFLFLIVSIGLKKEIKELLSCLYSKNGLFIILGGLLGGPIGMSCYVLAVNYLSPSLSAAISSFYPALGALFSYLLLKEKMSGIQIFGLILSILGVVIVGYEPLDIKFQFGFIFALICTIGWSLEAVIVGYGLKESQINDNYALTIRQGTSSLFYLFIIFPIIRMTALNTINIPFIYIVIAALFGTLSYLFYYRSIKDIGANLSMALNITYSGFAIIITSIMTLSLPDIKNVICALLIISGSILAYIKRTL